MLLSAAVVGLAGLQGVAAWGFMCHATVAYVAQSFLTPDTAAWAQGVLNDTSDSYLANIASWADEYSATEAGKWSAPLHFINAEDSPPASCSVDFARDCGSAGCSVSAIANYTQRVADGRLTNDHVAEALKFLVHLVADVTQPLHNEALAEGGNDIAVVFDGHYDNLHNAWDTDIPQKLVGGGSQVVAHNWALGLSRNIASGALEDQAASWIAGDDIDDPIGSATAWAADANALVCSAVMPEGVAALQQGDLYPAYYNSVIVTVEIQIAKAGFRLAHWLNAIFAAKIAKRSV